jgi:mRNA interferase MazF
MVGYVPERGDIIWIDFDPQVGTEIKKKRPALVISPSDYNKKTGRALLLPITSQIKGYPFEVVIKNQDIKGAILSDQIKNLDWIARKAKKITNASEVEVKETLKKLAVLIMI